MALNPPGPEFSRPLEVGRVPQGGCLEKIAASADECRLLAKRLDLSALYALRAEIFARPWRGGGVMLTGEITAELERISVISLEPFRQQQNIHLERYFLPGSPDDENGEAEPIDEIVGGQVDLGEVVAETLALELDPYPKKPGEVFSQDGHKDEEAAGGAFTALRVLRSDKGKRR